MGAGQSTVGGCESPTTTGKLHRDWLPAPSTAVHVTAVVPSANVLPEAGAHTVLTAPQLSCAAGAKLACAPPPLHSNTGTPGHSTAGGALSCTVTVASHVLLSPNESVHVNVTRCRPNPNGPSCDCTHPTSPSSGSYEPSFTLPPPWHAPSAPTTRLRHRATGRRFTHVLPSQLGPSTGSSHTNSWKPVAGSGNPAVYAYTRTVFPHACSCAGKEKLGSIPHSVHSVTSGPPFNWYHTLSTSAGLLFTRPVTVMEAPVAHVGLASSTTASGGTSFNLCPHPNVTESGWKVAVLVLPFAFTSVAPGLSV
jgi:hypothetical protein